VVDDKESFVVYLFQPWWISVLQKSNGLIIRRACSEFAFSKPLLAQFVKGSNSRATQRCDLNDCSCAVEAWETLGAAAFIEASSVNVSFSAVLETAQKRISAKMLQPVGGGRRRKNWPALTWQAGPFCSGKEQRSFRLPGFSLRRYGNNVYVPNSIFGA